MRKKNKHAVALGRIGGAAGKGSPARKRAARRAARARWRKFRATNGDLAKIPENKV